MSKHELAMDPVNLEVHDAPIEFPDSVPPAGARGRVICDDINIRIDRDGVWYYEGSPIGRKELVCLFASVLFRDSAGRYWLVTPAEMCQVHVDDVPFLGVELFAAGCGAEQVLSVRTNIDEIVTLDRDHPLKVVHDPVTNEPRPYLRVRPGLSARISRPVFYELVELGVPGTDAKEPIADRDAAPSNATVVGVWSSGEFFPLGRLDQAL